MSLNFEEANAEKSSFDDSEDTEIDNSVGISMENDYEAKQCN